MHVMSKESSFIKNNRYLEKLSLLYKCYECSKIKQQNVFFLNFITKEEKTSAAQTSRNFTKEKKQHLNNSKILLCTTGLRKFQILGDYVLQELVLFVIHIGLNLRNVQYSCINVNKFLILHIEK